MQVVTWITYEDWRKEVRFCIDPVEEASRLSVTTISYPELTDEQVSEIRSIQDWSIKRIQEVLSKYF